MPFTPIYKKFLSDTGQSVPQDGSYVGNGPVIVTPNDEGDNEPRNPEPDHRQRYLWCIDAGHGEYSRGKRSPVLDSPVFIITEQYTLREWEFNRDVAERLIELLVAAGIAFMRTMPQDGRHGNALAERVRSANQYITDLPKRGVSIHSNAVGNGGWVPEVDGVETWHYSRSNIGKKVASVFNRRIHAAAERFSFSRGLGTLPNRGLKYKTTGEFYVLKNTGYPNVLTETLFMTSPNGVKMLADPEFRQEIAEAHFDAIIEIETAPEPVLLEKEKGDRVLEVLTLLNYILTLFQTNPEERKTRRRQRYIKSLQRRESKGKITRVQYDRYLADYDKQTT